MALADEIHRLQMRKAGRADLAFVGLVGAVGDQINAKLAFRRLDASVNFAGRNVEALGIKLEVMDQGLHRALHLATARRNDLVVLERHRTVAIRRAQLYNALFHDAHGLAHFFHADQIAVVTISVLAHRNIEIHLGVALVRLSLAQIPRRTGAADHHAGKSPFPGLLERNHPDVDVALLEDSVAGEQPVEIDDHAQKRIAPGLDVAYQFRRQVLVHAADPEIGRMHARAGRALVEYHQLFALFKTPQRWRQRADVHRLRGDVEKMREDAADLAVQDPDQLPAARRGNAEQLFRRKTERVFLIHRRDIVEPVEIRDRLQIGLVLDQFLGAAVKQADMRVDPRDHFAVELQHQTQHAVRGRMLRAEVDREVAEVVFGHRAGQLLAASLLVAGKDRIVRAFPWREEVEVAEFLVETDGFVEHPLLLIVVTHLDEAGEREILAQRGALKAVV